MKTIDHNTTHGADELSRIDVLMMAALDGTIAMPDRRELEAYLSTHKSEQAVFAEMLAFESAVASSKRNVLSAPAPADFSKNVMTAVRATAIAALSPAQNTTALTPLSRQQIVWTLILSSVLATTVLVVIGGMAYSLFGNLHLTSLARAAYTVGADTAELAIAIGRGLLARPVTWVLILAGIAACAGWFSLIARAWRPVQQYA